MPDVKIKGYSGAEMEYKAVPKVWLAAPESTEDNPVLVPFTYGEAEELTVDLSFPAVESSKIEVFPAQTVEGFYYSNPFGCFVTGITPAPFVPVLGDTYSVEWDGEQFDRTAFEFTAPDGASCIGIGNTIMAGVDSGEPFLVCYDVPNGYFYFFSTQQDASHEIAVYRVEGSGEGSAMVVVPTGEGKIISKVTIPKPDGLVPGNIKKGESVAGVTGVYEGEAPETEDATVPLNMANGDQVIVPSEGKYLAKATVQMPDTLIPENIAEGVNIGGIIGALAAGGSSIVMKKGTFTGNGSLYTLSHNLGCIPDVLIVYSTLATTSSVLQSAVGFSTALFTKLSLSHGGYSNIGSGGIWGYNNKGCLDTTLTSVPLNNANASTVKVGDSSHKFPGSTTYYWIAIGGLT